MYSYNERMEVEKLLKQGINIKEISTNTGISISTLYKWKKEIELERHIQGLIKKGHIDDANNEINHLDSNYGREITALRLKSEIAKEEGDEEKEKDLLRERIEKNPEDIKAFWRLIKIIKSEGNGEEERILLEKQLKRNPNNVRIINRLIKLAQEQNDIERERSLQETKLKIDEKNVNTIGRLINLARLSNDVEREKELLQKLLEMNPRDPKALKSSVRIATIEGNATELNRLSEIDSLDVTLLDKARKTIYEADDYPEMFEEIAEILNEIDDEIVKILIQAEAAKKVGLTNKSIELLKKQITEHRADNDAKKSLNKALELARKKICDQERWEKLYREYNKMRAKKENEGDNKARDKVEDDITL